MDVQDDRDMNDFSDDELKAMSPQEFTDLIIRERRRVASITMSLANQNRFLERRHDPTFEYVIVRDDRGKIVDMPEIPRTKGERIATLLERAGGDPRAIPQSDFDASGLTLADVNEHLMDLEDYKADARRQLGLDHPADT